MISDHVVFTTPFFEVQPGEDEGTNPGIYGRALAQWLAARLEARGVPVLEVIAEDFGRCVMIARRPFMVFVACASLDDSTTRWQMFIAVERRLVSWLRRMRPEAELDRLRPHYKAIIEEIPAVTDIEWQVAP